MGFFGQTNIGVDPSVVLKLARVIRGWTAEGVLTTSGITATVATVALGGVLYFETVVRQSPPVIECAVPITHAPK